MDCKKMLTALACGWAGMTLLEKSFDDNITFRVFKAS